MVDGTLIAIILVYFLPCRPNSDFLAFISGPRKHVQVIKEGVGTVVEHYLLIDVVMYLYIV